MTLTSSPRHQHTVPNPQKRSNLPKRKRTARLLIGGATVVALAGLGVALVSAQLGQSTASQSEPPVRDAVLAAPSDAEKPSDAGTSSDADTSGDAGAGNAPNPSDAGAENSDGRLPFGTTAFDTEYAGISNLSPSLLDALQVATRDAESAGVYVMVNSGWRSTELQSQLLQDARAEYGSEEEAARWVASPETSLHVSGDAVDVEGGGASDWLATNGAAYGLCQTYLNEPWHFEFQASASSNGCAEQYLDPTYDPRLRG
ncbi:peptidase M15 [Pseudoclavibacter sp. AY1F1]|uniref:M15 family metallopeptidase n=1 Tax=Pseudoclavibacter sp. AY1F1 TaxID=2080583 RepID=UPI000CE7EC34|nr:M15 family metallopeptidase [Pseudoclavibacter sp. AY1F1]PPF44817.1 peptidase M15 [Pseudoclavibacter sp. AY1F1]